MSFKQFILTEGRSTALELDKAVAMYKKNCKNYRWNDQALYRGNRSSSAPMFIDPKKHERKSANTENYYTLWTDNSKKWSKYPNRSQSIICTSRRQYALGYGEAFIVIPFDGATIGICSEDDWWQSFSKSLQNFPRTVMSMGGFMKELQQAVANLLGKTPADARKIMSKDYNSLVKTLKKGDKKFKEDAEWSERATLDMYKVIDYYDGFMNMMEYVLDPKNNGFKVIPFDKYSMDNFPNNEIWTDSPCLMIDPGEEVFDEFRKRVT